MNRDRAIWHTRGTDRTVQVFVRDEDGLPYDLTGAVGYLTVKFRKEDAAATFQKVTSAPAEGAIAVPESGIMEFYILAADTEDEDPGSYVYDVQVVTGGLRYSVVTMSPFEIEWDIG
jgi:hypothetical protein